MTIVANPLGSLIVERLSAPCCAAQQLTLEQAMFDSLLGKSQHLRIWEPLPALIVTAGEAKLPTFAAAAANAEQDGLPVYVRRSGGGAVCLGPGMLVVTHLYSSQRNDIDASYREFAQSLIAAVSSLGVLLEKTHVLRAYCDGKFDLAWRSLKVGGIAQRRRIQSGTVHVWIHAVLAIESQSLTYPQVVAAFYSDLGLSRIADPRSATSLSQCLPHHLSAVGLLPRCGTAIVESFCSALNSELLL